MLNSTPLLSGTTGHKPAGRSASHPAHPHDIGREVQRTLEGSLDYQILRKTLIGDQAARASERTETPASSTSNESVDQYAAPAHTAPEQVSGAAVAAELRVAEARMRQQTQIEVRELRVDSGNPPVQQSDPLLLDLDGDGAETSGLARGLRFDIDADGDLDLTSFAAGGDAFLALDRNGNGRIDDGSELFGDQRGHANGFAALADYDDNQDGIIDARDSIFEHLQLVRIAQGSLETSSLGSYGIAAIGLSYTPTSQLINPWDRVTQAGSFQFDNGQTGRAVDVVVGHREA